MQISCENLNMSYEGQTVIDSLSFCVNKGDYLCVVGENGSGKSTLIKGLLNLKKASQGKIYVDKTAKIGYLPQKTPAQKDFPASVWEVVLSGTLNTKKLLPFYSRSQKKKAEDCLEKLNILDLKKACYRNLSGGQQQRVFLARALCAAEDLLLLDEPVNGLDPVAAQEFYELIKNINKSGTTIIMVTHDISHALKYGAHILHLSENDTFFGTKDEYLNSDLFKNFGGGKKL